MQVDAHSNTKCNTDMNTQISNLQSQWIMHNIEIDIVQLKTFQWLFQGWLDQLWLKGCAPQLQRLKNKSCIKNTLGSLFWPYKACPILLSQPSIKSGHMALKRQVLGINHQGILIL